MFKIKTGKLYGRYVHPWGIEYTEKNIKIRKWKEIITLEDHFSDGGFGSWLKESYNGNKTKIFSESIGTNVTGKTGTESYLIKKYFSK